MKFGCLRGKSCALDGVFSRDIALFVVGGPGAIKNGLHPMSWTK
jgi:hypothetical protein